MRFSISCVSLDKIFFLPNTTYVFFLPNFFLLKTKISLLGQMYKDKKMLYYNKHYQNLVETSKCKHLLFLSNCLNTEHLQTTRKNMLLINLLFDFQEPICLCYSYP